MTWLWRAYRLACVAIVSLVLTAALIVGGAGLLATLAAKPVAEIPSPDGAFRIKVFSAGQGAVPPDYRSDVRFYLQDTVHWQPFGMKLIAAAALADGWSVTWNKARKVSIDTGRLAWFDTVRPEANGVSIQVHSAEGSPGEARCLEQSFASTVDGVVCFDALLRRAEAPATGTP